MSTSHYQSNFRNKIKTKTGLKKLRKTEGHVSSSLYFQTKQKKMGFCIYCNYKVNSSATTCPKCYRTLATAKANNPQQPIVPFALHSNKTDKWQDT